MNQIPLLRTITLASALLCVSAAPGSDVPVVAPSHPAMPSARRPSQKLMGTEWRWRKLYDGPGPTVVPKDVSLYTLKFGTDGKLAIRADCNRATTSWKAEGEALKLGPIAGKFAACQAGSLSDPFLKALGRVEALGRTGRNLELRLRNDEGILSFEPASPKQSGHRAAAKPASERT